MLKILFWKVFYNISEINHEISEFSVEIYFFLKESLSTFGSTLNIWIINLLDFKSVVLACDYFWVYIFGPSDENTSGIHPVSFCPDHLVLPEPPGQLLLLSPPEAFTANRQGHADKNQENESNHQPAAGAHAVQPAANGERDRRQADQ